jgi:hypothetical protein
MGRSKQSPLKGTRAWVSRQFLRCFNHAKGFVSRECIVRVTEARVSKSSIVELIVGLGNIDDELNRDGKRDRYVLSPVNVPVPFVLTKSKNARLLSCRALRREATQGDDPLR